MQPAAWTLGLLGGPVSVRMDRAALLAMPQHAARLPIACVEGWSTTQTWTGVRLSCQGTLARRYQLGVTTLLVADTLADITDHLIARPELGDTEPGPFDNAGDIPAGNDGKERRYARIENALAQPEIGRIHRCRSNPNQDGIDMKFGLVDLEYLWSAVPPVDDSLHLTHPGRPSAGP